VETPGIKVLVPTCSSALVKLREKPGPMIHPNQPGIDTVLI